MQNTQTHKHTHTYPGGEYRVLLRGKTDINPTNHGDLTNQYATCN